MGLHRESSQQLFGGLPGREPQQTAAEIAHRLVRPVVCFLVGHSTGSGQVASYMGRHGSKRVAKAVLLAAVPPIMVKSAANPEGLRIEVFDKLRSDLGLINCEMCGKQ